MMCIKSNCSTVQFKLTQCMRTCSVAKSCLTLCDPMDCSPPGSSGPEIFQARILEWVDIFSSKTYTVLYVNYTSIKLERKNKTEKNLWGISHQVNISLLILTQPFLGPKQRVDQIRETPPVNPENELYVHTPKGKLRVLCFKHPRRSAEP